MKTLHQITTMTSGMCRWVGRPDIHVYCHAPAGRDARYCIVCPDAGIDYLPYAEWTTASVVARMIDSILAQEAAHVA